MGPGMKLWRQQNLASRGGHILKLTGSGNDLVFVFCDVGEALRASPAPLQNSSRYIARRCREFAAPSLTQVLGLPRQQ